MPEFSTPFSVVKNENQLTERELARAIRYSIAAEYEAVQLYQQLSESTDNKLAKAVLEDIANEEKEHVGEFLEVLKQICPKECQYYESGSKEVREIIDELAKE